MLTFNSTILAVLINFVIMLFIVQRYLFKPIGKILDDRENKIKTELAQSEKHLADAQNDRSQSERILGEARRDAQQILDKARAQSEQLKIELNDKVQADLEQVKQHTHQSLAMEREAMLANLRKDAAMLAVLAAEKVLEDVLDEPLKQRLQQVAHKKLSAKDIVLV